MLVDRLALLQCLLVLQNHLVQQAVQVLRKQAFAICLAHFLLVAYSIQEGVELVKLVSRLL